LGKVQMEWIALEVELPNRPLFLTSTSLGLDEKLPHSEESR